MMTGKLGALVHLAGRNFLLSVSVLSACPSVHTRRDALCTGTLDRHTSTCAYLRNMFPIPRGATTTQTQPQYNDQQPATTQQDPSLAPQQQDERRGELHVTSYRKSYSNNTVKRPLTLTLTNTTTVTTNDVVNYNVTCYHW
jgi:hypothetical protein